MSVDTLQSITMILLAISNFCNLMAILSMSR